MFDVMPGIERAANEKSNALAQDPELISDFITESREHLASIESQLLALEQHPDDRESIQSIFRGFHTIKGLAGFLEFAAIQAVAHEVETLLDLARNGKLAFTTAVIDVVLASVDYLRGEVGRVERALRGGERETSIDNQALLVAVRDLLGQALEAAAAPAPAGRATASSSLSHSLGDLSQAISGREPTEQEGGVIPALEAKSEKQAQAGDTRSVKVDIAKLDHLLGVVGEMVIAQSMIRHDAEMEKVSTSRLLRNFSQLESITERIQKAAMSMRMVRVGVLFQKMGRLVRDLSRKHSKQVDFETSGDDTELDRTIVEELSDPLMHMVRNAIDHGIEAPEARRAAGKNPAAKLLLSAFHQAGDICIQISDDGRGLNKEKILAKARQEGLIEASQHPSDNEMFNLILEPGFSTADQVTHLSGRGVGMDVVHTKVQRLRGRIDIQSIEGQGTTFILTLPVTLAGQREYPT
jgi:two-component system chemotaxis sensor kinase CheA